MIKQELYFPGRNIDARFLFFHLSGTECGGRPCTSSRPGHISAVWVMMLFTSSLPFPVETFSVFMGADAGGRGDGEDASSLVQNSEGNVPPEIAIFTDIFLKNLPRSLDFSIFSK